MKIICKDNLYSVVEMTKYEERELRRISEALNIITGRFTNIEESAFVMEYPNSSMTELVNRVRKIVEYRDTSKKDVTYVEDSYNNELTDEERDNVLIYMNKMNPISEEEVIKFIDIPNDMVRYVSSPYIYKLDKNKILLALKQYIEGYIEKEYINRRNRKTKSYIQDLIGAREHKM